MPAVLVFNWGRPLAPTRGVWILLLCLSFVVCLGANPKTTRPSAPTTDDNSRSDDDDDDDARLSQLWLDDFDTELSQGDNEVGDVMLSDSPLMGDGPEDGDAKDAEPDDEDEPVCPPPPFHLPPFSCAVEQCQSDTECHSGTRCCFNGCRYTCMTPVQSAPYIDWKRQPQRRLASGSSWLIPGAEEPEVEWCSTTAVYDTDEEPLLCPHGYICHIEDPGDPAKSVPNSGRCVLGQEMPGSSQRHTNMQLKPGADCLIGVDRHLNGTTFKYMRHSCICRTGAVFCRVGKSTQRRKQRGKATRENAPPSDSDTRIGK